MNKLLGRVSGVLVMIAVASGACADGRDRNTIQRTEAEVINDISELMLGPLGEAAANQYPPEAMRVVCSQLTRNLGVASPWIDDFAGEMEERVRELSVRALRVGQKCTSTLRVDVGEVESIAEQFKALTKIGS